MTAKQARLAQESNQLEANKMVLQRYFDEIVNNRNYGAILDPRAAVCA